MLHRFFAKHQNGARSILGILLCLSLVCSNIEPLYGLASESETETLTEAVTVGASSEELTESLTETQTDASTGETAEAGTEAETAISMGTETQISTETETELTTETATEASTEFTTEDETESEVSTELTTETETEIETESETETETETETESESDVLFETELTDGVKAEVSAAAGAFPAGTTISVTLLEENAQDQTVADMYSDAEQALKDNSVSFEGLLALDISFLNAEGAEIEPEQGEVTVKLELEASLLAYDADIATLVM